MSTTASSAKIALRDRRSMKSGPLLEMRGDFLRETLSDFGLGEFRPGLGARRRNEMNGVFVAAHDAGRGRDVVGDDPVAAFLGAFGFGVLDDLLCLSCKAHDKARPLRRMGRERAKDVGVFD